MRMQRSCILLTMVFLFIPLPVLRTAQEGKKSPTPHSGSIDAVRFALKNFYEHADDLEERRQKDGTHEGEFGIAPYYFYFGHRYAAQAIQMLPEKERAKERARLLKPIIETRNEDGTWNDRVFERARYVGTAMMVLALLGDKTPLPPQLTKK